MNLLDTRTYYRPFNYPWAIQATEEHEAMHWLPQEVPLADDVRDWKSNLTSAEKTLLTQIFRFFTQADIDVAGGYNDVYIPALGKQQEIAMMLTSFAAREGVHIMAYSHLLDTVGMPETEYQAFAEYEAMVNKHDYMGSFKTLGAADYKKRLALALAVFSAFGEGMQLFSSFAILMNFPRQGKMKGMGTIVDWSLRDESLHVKYMIKLFRTFIAENHYLWTDEFKAQIYEVARQMVTLEDKFIDLAFGVGGITGLTPEEVKQYVRYIADRRLLQLGLRANFEVKHNPLPWLDEILNSVEHVNFFENKVTEYQKASMTGSWDDVFGEAV